MDTIPYHSSYIKFYNRNCYAIKNMRLSNFSINIKNKQINKYTNIILLSPQTHQGDQKDKF